jgi:hypothetical protein
MISWIVATHDRTILEANLLPGLPADDELLLVEDAPSIAAAYNEGQSRATHQLRCYVHHDVAILDAARLRERLAAACAPEVGMVGVIGSREPVWPWWNGSTLGSVFDTRLGLLDFGAGGPCAYLDGLLLATAQTVEWDERYPGWHGYDHDMCAQMLARGLSNFCLSAGHLMVRHSTDGPTDPDAITGWAEAAARYREKWGHADEPGR